MGDLKQALKEVDVLTINDEEAKQLSEEGSLIRASRKILTMGPKFLIIKKGEHGAVLFSKQKTFYCPALPLERVLDPTGAGDSFAGGFVGYLDKTEDFSFENMKRAVVHGSITASFCVESFGTERLHQIKEEQINYRKEEIKEIISVDL
tara:strand:+ start:88 stop:534 length:447 start_codon:yes stop_codon:yes gene_type:complete